MTAFETEILRPTRFARRLGVETIVVIRAMHARTVPTVKMDDGTLGIPASALASFPTA